ncbi:Hypothetical protein D9617_8g051310 [Elsinoe fawcettii]|nr:Hypothetical protein D9617_8g051310 [Elsinoe fawcettii]
MNFSNTTTTAIDPGPWLSSNISALPTPIDPASCTLHMSPVYHVWVPNPTAPVVGTKYIYVTANASATSTSITCDQAAYTSQKDWRYAVEMGTDCSFTGTMQNVHYISIATPSVTVTYPGPTTELTIGDFFHAQWYWPTTAGWWSTTMSTGKVYTDKDWSLVDDSIYNVRMPSMPKYYPELADLFRNCTTILWETAPNSLTYANFLTSYITAPAAVIGELTVPASRPTAQLGQAAPAITLVASPKPIATSAGFPTPARPRPHTAVETGSTSGGIGSGADTSSDATPGVQAETGSTAGSSGSGAGVPSSEAHGNQAEADLSGDAVSHPGSAHSNSKSDSSSPNSPNRNQNQDATSTVTNLVLPGGQTAHPGGSAVTVSSRIISLDALGTVHIAALKTGAAQGGSQNGQFLDGAVEGEVLQSIAIPLSALVASGRLDALGVSLAISVKTEVVRAGAGEAGSADGAAASIGRIVGGIGRWIAGGLAGVAGVGGSASSSGAAHGQSVSSRTTTAGRPNGTGTSSVVPFTGRGVSTRNVELALFGTALIGSLVTVAVL